MPEGDSIRRAAARLRLLVGDRVEASSPSPRGLATNVARAVDGRVLESVDAVGKHLLLRFEGGIVVRSHLRMNGRWRVRARDGRPPQGRPWLVLTTDRWEATQWNGPVLTIDDGRAARIGPDLLADETTVDRIVERIRAVDQHRLLGDVLLDQRVVAGIGNMWLAEILWHARLSPWLEVGAAGDDELAACTGVGAGGDARIRRGPAPAARRLSPSGTALPSVWRNDPVTRSRRAEPHRVLVRGVPARVVTAGPRAGIGRSAVYLSSWPRARRSSTTPSGPSRSGRSRISCASSTTPASPSRSHSRSTRARTGPPSTSTARSCGTSSRRALSGCAGARTP